MNILDESVCEGVCVAREKDLERGRERSGGTLGKYYVTWENLGENITLHRNSHPDTQFIVFHRENQTENDNYELNASILLNLLHYRLAQKNSKRKRKKDI